MFGWSSRPLMIALSYVEIETKERGHEAPEHPAGGSEQAGGGRARAVLPRRGRRREEDGLRVRPARAEPERRRRRARRHARTDPSGGRERQGGAGCRRGHAGRHREDEHLRYRHRGVLQAHRRPYGILRRAADEHHRRGPPAGPPRPPRRGRGDRGGGLTMGDTRRSRARHRVLLGVILCVLVLADPMRAHPQGGKAAPGEIRWGLHVTLAARWLDPAETEAFNTPFMVMYAVHDALVKPMPPGITTPSLAESWTEAKDHLSYTFMLRKGARFHNGEPVTADDVKFSWDRYTGASAKLLKDKVKEVQILDPGQVRFVLREPWPDFITFYGTTASGAGWIVPKKYVEKVGDDGFKAAPIGAGPYKVVSFKPGIEIVLEAFDGYWRKSPAVKRLVMRSMPEEATRAAALRAGEVDVVYLLTGPTADAVRKVSGFRLAAPLVSGAFWIELPEQWDPKSPWADQRVRLAASHAIDRAAINQAEMLGFRPAHRKLRAADLPVRGGDGAARLRSREGEEAARRGRLSERLRRRRLLSVPALRLDGRGHPGQLPGGRHQESPAHDGARGVLHRLARQEAPRRHPRDHGGLRQRGHTARALRHQERRLRLRIIARDRRPLHPSGA